MLLKKLEKMLGETLFYSFMGLLRKKQVKTDEAIKEALELWIKEQRFRDEK
jgi:hypothetical protein